MPAGDQPLQSSEDTEVRRVAGLTEPHADPEKI
jgi:hypothetical protein